MHKHICVYCGCIWQHEDSCKGNAAAHTCPSCGEPDQYDWYRGENMPQFTCHHKQQQTEEARP
jgi:Zn ribbon nucleic-acid-binding protein